MARILLVDDEATLIAALRFNLEREGHDVLTASDGGDAVEAAEREQPDLILLDLMLPGMHGFEVCRVLRKRTSIPIIIVTARSDEVDRVVGLELGADDYITKPFSMLELMSRVRACLRRAREMPATPVSEVISMGRIEVDLRKHEVSRDGVPLDLNLKEYQLLVALIRNRGEVLTRDRLFRDVWKDDGLGSSRTVDVHIGRLRQKIEDDASNPITIITVRGAGYRFNA